MCIEKQLIERIESRLEVMAYIQDLQYSLQHGAKIQYQRKRYVERFRDEKYSNEYTVADLFPNQDVLKVLLRELMSLKVENYIRTVKDVNRPKNSEMREFGKVYETDKEVYIKIRVEVMKSGGFGVDNIVFIMSFHYSTVPFDELTFPYQ